MYKSRNNGLLPEKKLFNKHFVMNNNKKIVSFTPH